MNANQTQAKHIAPLTMPSSVCLLSTRGLLGMVLSALTLSSVHAGIHSNNLPKDDTAAVTVGVNAYVSDDGYDIDGTSVTVLPSLFYDNNKIYARGSQFGGYLINDGTSQLAVFAQPGGSSFKPKDANGALSGLDERKWTAMAGVSHLYRSPIGGVRGQVMTDALGRSDGTVARLTYLAKYQQHKLTVYPSIGLEWVDGNYNDHYYGISQQEAAKTGLAEYHPSSSISPYASVKVNYDLSDDWALFFSQDVSYIPDEQYDSPMVDSRTAYSTMLGVLYTF